MKPMTFPLAQWFQARSERPLRETALRSGELGRPFKDQDKGPFRFIAEWLESP